MDPDPDPFHLIGIQIRFGSSVDLKNGSRSYPSHIIGIQIWFGSISVLDISIESVNANCLVHTKPETLATLLKIQLLLDRNHETDNDIRMITDPSKENITEKKIR